MPPLPPPDLIPQGLLPLCHKEVYVSDHMYNVYTIVLLLYKKYLCQGEQNPYALVEVHVYHKSQQVRYKYLVWQLMPRHYTGQCYIQLPVLPRCNSVHSSPNTKEMRFLLIFDRAITTEKKP